MANRRSLVLATAFLTVKIAIVLTGWWVFTHCADWWGDP
jgi:hypothetical protein